MGQVKIKESPVYSLVNQTTGGQWPLENELLVGLKTGFQGEGISSQHCLLRSNGYQFFIIDLKSQNGTYVNGERIPSDQWTALTHGQQISVGDCQLIFSDNMFAFSSDAIVVKEPVRLQVVSSLVSTQDSRPVVTPQVLFMQFLDGFFYMFAAYLSLLTAMNFLAFPGSRASLIVQMITSSEP